MEEKPKEIVIKIKTKNIKQIAYFAVPVILALLLILQYIFPISCPICECENQTQEENTTVTETQPVIPEPVPILEEPEPIVEPEPEPVQEPEEELLDITGEAEIDILDITHEIKGEDWAIVTKVKINIQNAKALSIDPVIEFYLFDDNDPTDQENYVEEKIILDELESGHEITETVKVHISFNEIDQEKTLKAVLKDDNKELDKIMKEFTASS